MSLLDSQHIHLLFLKHLNHFSPFSTVPAKILFAASPQSAPVLVFRKLPLHQPGDFLGRCHACGSQFNPFSTSSYNVRGMGPLRVYNLVRGTRSSRKSYLGLFNTFLDIFKSLCLYLILLLHSFYIILYFICRFLYLY